MRFAYTRRGGPLLDWSGPTPPYPTRAGETRSLGEYLGDFYPTTRTSAAVRRYGGMSAGHGGAAVGYEHDRALGVFYPTTRTSSALRRYGGRSVGHGGAAIGYEHNRALGAYYRGHQIGSGGAVYRPRALPVAALGDLNIPRPGSPEIIEGYEEPAPGAATIHLGEECTWDVAHRRSHGLSGFIPEGAARKFGQQMLEADEPPAPKPLIDRRMIRKASVLASAYHGVKRNHGSVFWGLAWALAAYITPVNGLLVPALGVAQGFGTPK